MPADNIDRAIKKGTGELAGESYAEVRYEGYGPNGVAVMIDTLTDNRNRTVGEIRRLFTKHGGNLGAGGCVAYLFEQKGILSFDRAGLDGEGLMEAAIEANAEDRYVDPVHPALVHLGLGETDRAIRLLEGAEPPHLQSVRGDILETGGVRQKIGSD